MIDWLILFGLILSFNSIRDFNIRNHSIEYRKRQIEKKAYKNSIFGQHNVPEAKIQHVWKKRRGMWRYGGLRSSGGVTLKPRMFAVLKRKLCNKKLWKRALPIVIVAIVSTHYMEAAIMLPLAAYTSTQSGDWDNVATWGGGGFPTIADTGTVADTHIVSVKGNEACSSFTINVGGTLRLDGQSDTVNAVLTCSTGSTSTNNGTIDETGTGTKYARISGEGAPGAHIIAGSQPTFGAGYWYFGTGTHFDMALLTGGGGAYIGGVVNSHNLTVQTGDSVDTIYAFGFVTLDNGSLLPEGLLTIFYSDGLFTDNRVSQVPQVNDFRITTGVTATLGNHATLQYIEIEGTFNLNNFNLALTNSAIYSGGIGIYLLPTGEYIKGTGALTITSPNGSSIDYIYTGKDTSDDYGPITYTSDHDLVIQSASGGSYITITSLSLNGAGTFNSGNKTLTFHSNVTTANGFTWVQGTGTIVFDATTTYTDNNGTPQNIGNIYISGILTLANAKPIRATEIDIVGTLIADGTNQITCDGDWYCTLGTFVYSTSHVHLTSTSTITGMIGATNGFFNLTIELGADVISDSFVRVSGSKTVTGTDNKSGTTTKITYVYGDLVIAGTLNSKNAYQGVIIYTGSRVPTVQSPYMNIIQKGGT